MDSASSVDIDDNKIRGSSFSESIDRLIEHASWRSSVGNELDLIMGRVMQKRIRDVDLIIAPVVYCCCQGVSKLLFMTIGFLYLIYCVLSIHILFVQGVFPRAYSVKVSSLRSLHGNSISVASLDLHTLCNSTTSINVSETFSIYGFAIKFNSSRRCSGDKFFFTLQSDDDTNKHIVGSSSVRWTSTELRFVDSGVDDCSDTVDLKYQPRWPWYFGPESPLFLALASASYLITGIGAIFQRFAVIKNFIIFMLITLTLITTISFAGFLSIHSQKEAYYPCSLSVGFAVSSLALMTSERSAIDRSLLISPWFLLCRIVNDVAVFEDVAYLQSRPPVIQCSFILVSMYLAWRSRAFARGTIARVARDRPAFDAAWEESKRSPSSAADLARLAALADSMVRCCASDSHGPLQRNRVRPAVEQSRNSDGHAPRRTPSALEAWVTTWFTESESEARHQPSTLTGTAGLAVSSLDQLYSQAMLAAPALLSQCEQWAALCAGRLDHGVSSLTEGGLTSGDLRVPLTLRRLVRMRAVKCPWAAATKAVACYSGDVARLLDVCRCRIVFDTFADLARCLAAVAASPAVRVVRVRNWLRDEHDPFASAGFRAVVVLLRLDSDEARRSGIENLVCELQLVPGPMAVALRSTSHSCYRDFRALRQNSAIGLQPTPASAHLAQPEPGEPTAIGTVARAWSDGVDSECVRMNLGDATITGTNAGFGSRSPASLAVSSQLHETEELGSGSVVTAAPVDLMLSQAHAAAEEVAAEAAAAPSAAHHQFGPSLAMPMLPPDTDYCVPVDRTILEECGSFTAVGTVRCIKDRDATWMPAVTAKRSQGLRCNRPCEGREMDVAQNSRNSTLWAALVEAAHVVHQRYSLGDHRTLDQEASKFEQALNASSSASVLFSSTPFAAYAAKPMGKVRISILAAIWIAFVVSLCIRILDVGTGHLDHPIVRFRTLERFNLNPDMLVSAADTAGVATFGLLENDCRIPRTWPAPENSSGMLLFDSQAVPGQPRANGYFFTLPTAGLPDSDPTRWVVEASGDMGISWKPVSSCLWVTARTSSDGGRSWWPLGGSAGRLVDCTDGVLGLVPSGSGRTALSLARGSEVRVDFRADAASLWLTFGFLVAPVGWCCAAACALSGQPRRVKPILVTVMGGWSVWSLCWEIASGAQGSGWQRGLYLWISFLHLPALWSAVAFQVLERHLVLLFFIDGLLFWAGLTVLGAVIYGHGMTAALQRDESCLLMIAVGLYLSLGSMVFFFLRRRALRRARQLVEVDCARYDTAWGQILQTQNDFCVLLAKAATDLESRVGKCVSRQTRRSIPVRSSIISGSLKMEPGSGIFALLLQGSSRRINPTGSGFLRPSFLSRGDRVQQRPLRSLDQLYVQAAFVQPILVHKVKQWAAGRGGCLPNATPGESISFVRFESGDAAEDALSLRFCDLKSPGRAIEKLVRSYGQDTSRLLDVCRQAIAFEGMQDMADCLNAIGSDPEVRIVRIKNRYTPGYDAAQSGGYRDVLLNLQICTPEALLFGVEAHVCELQLILWQFAALKTKDGHSHYVAVRNLRAD